MSNPRQTNQSEHKASDSHQPLVSPASEEKGISFDLSDITEFNPALIYGFEPESSINPNNSMVAVALHNVNQWRDMYKAYHYAQTEILSTIKTQGIANLGVEQVTEWLHQLHRRISDTLAKDHHTPAYAGSFCKEQLFQWKHTTIAQGVFRDCLDKGITSFTQIPTNYLDELMEKLGTDAAEVRSLAIDGSFDAFLALLYRINNNPKIVIEKDQEQYAKVKDAYKLTSKRALFKLAAAIHQKQLSQAEEALVAKFVKIFPSPATAPARMKKLVTEFLSKWKRAALSSQTQEIASVARDAFYGITENHFYFNANGRLGTAFMNLFLRSVGQRSILLRFPGERFEASSSYSQAIAHINDSPELLISHIHDRLTSTATFEHELATDVFKKRMEQTVLLEAMQKDYSVAQLDKMYEDIEAQGYVKFNFASIPAETWERDEKLRHQYSIKILEYQIEQLRIVHKKLHQAKQATPSLSQAAPVVQRQYTDEEKTNIQRKLEVLTGKTGWKPYQDKSGATKVRLELGELKVEELAAAKSLAQALQDTNALKAKVMHPNTVPVKHILVLEDINPALLEKVEPLKGITLVAAVKSSSEIPAVTM